MLKVLLTFAPVEVLFLVIRCGVRTPSCQYNPLNIVDEYE